MEPRIVAARIVLSEKQEDILTQLKSGTHNPSHLRQRAEIILQSNENKSNNAIERDMGINGETVTKWRNRYAAAEKELSAMETESPLKLRSQIIKVLSDEARSGKPPIFTDEQVACIIAMSCKKPEEMGLPFSHWSHSSLRDEAIKRGIVDSISAVQIGNFLKGARSKTASS